MKPQVEAISEEFAGKADFYRMEVGPNRELLIQLDVSGLPTFLFYKEGRPQSTLAGKNILIEEILEHTQGLVA